MSFTKRGKPVAISLGREKRESLHSRISQRKKGGQWGSSITRLQFLKEGGKGVETSDEHAVKREEGGSHRRRKGSLFPLIKEGELSSFHFQKEKGGGQRGLRKRTIYSQREKRKGGAFIRGKDVRQHLEKRGKMRLVRPTKKEGGKKERKGPLCRGGEGSRGKRPTGKGRSSSGLPKEENHLAYRKENEGTKGVSQKRKGKTFSALSKRKKGREKGGHSAPRQGGTEKKQFLKGGGRGGLFLPICEGVDRRQKKKGGGQ